MHQAFKYRIYPTEEQKSYLLRTMGACRFIYNWGVATKTEQYTLTKKSDGFAGLCKKLTKLKTEKETVWLNECPNICLQQSLKHVETAFTKFFKKQTRYPKFHSKHDNKGSASYTSVGFRIRNGSLSLSRMEGEIEVRWHRELPCDANSCTVSVTPSGKFYASFLCVVEKDPLPKTDSQVGLDVGLTDFVVTSHGEKIKQPKKIKDYRKKLAKAQRNLARKKKGSNNRNKARIKVARAQEKITNARRDFLHNLSTRLVNENQVIGMEDVNTQGLMKNRCLSRRISEQGWREFRSMLEYKSARYGREFHVCDRFFPSSKTCSDCGKVKSKMPLNIREWTCECGSVHDRDVNAAKNILAAISVVSACGADGRPTANYRPRQSASKQEEEKFSG